MCSVWDGCSPAARDLGDFCRAIIARSDVEHDYDMRILYCNLLRIIRERIDALALDALSGGGRSA